MTIFTVFFISKHVNIFKPNLFHTNYYNSIICTIIGCSGTCYENYIQRLITNWFFISNISIIFFPYYVQKELLLPGLWSKESQNIVLYQGRQNTVETVREKLCNAIHVWLNHLTTWINSKYLNSYQKVHNFISKRKICLGRFRYCVGFFTCARRNLCIIDRELSFFSSDPVNWGNKIKKILQNSWQKLTV